MTLATAASAATSYVARVVQAPAFEKPQIAGQRPEPPEPPPPPREGREMPLPPGLNGNVQITASGKFVYVLRGDEILQFEATSLEFVKKIKLPPPEPPVRRERNRGEPRSRRGDGP